MCAERQACGASSVRSVKCAERQRAESQTYAIVNFPNHKENRTIFEQSSTIKLTFDPHFRFCFFLSHHQTHKGYLTQFRAT
jgi:hypothetical protein